MERSNLKQFITVARYLNFTEAAKHCNISRQGIRQNIQALEFELGCPLVQVEKNHVSLTPAGNALLLAMKPVIEQFDQQEAAFKSFLEQPETISFGYPTTLFPFILPTLLSSLTILEKETPSLHIKKRAFSPAELIETFCSGKIEAALMMTMFPTGIPNAHVTVLHEGCLGLTMSAQHPLASLVRAAEKPEDILTPARIAKETLVGFDTPDTTLTPLRDWMHTSGETLTVNIFDSVVSVLYEVGHHQALFVDVYEETAPELGPEFITVPLRAFPFHLCLVEQKDSAERISHRLFREQCKAHFNPVF